MRQGGDHEQGDDSGETAGAAALRLAALFHHRWAVPILAELAADQGAKLVTLEHRLGLGRHTLRATLDALIDQNLVMRNPGHGHPLRPEYILTASGQHVAPPSADLAGTIRRMHLEPVAFRKWPMPITWTLDQQPQRFTDLRNRLGAITPRALTLSLNDLREARLVASRGAEYRLTTRARPVVRGLEGLVGALGEEGNRQ